MLSQTFLIIHVIVLDLEYIYQVFGWPYRFCTQSTKKYLSQFVMIQLVEVLLYLFLLFFITIWTAVNYRPLPCSTAGATFPSEDSKNLSTFSDTRSIFIDSIFICSDSPSFCLEDTRSGQKRKKTIIGYIPQ